MTPEELDLAYLRIFKLHGDGVTVFDDLMGRYHDRAIYVPGGPEGARETERRAAQREVLEYIWLRVQRAEKGSPNDEETTL